MHSEIPAPVFLMFLIQNDLVLINYHIVPIVILYFWYFWYFTQLGWLYKPTYTFCNPNFNLSVHTRSFCPHFLSSLSSFSHFLGCQTPSNDDNLEDEQLKSFPPSSGRLLGVGSEGCWWFPVFHAVDFVILVPKFSTLGLKLFYVLSLANTWQAFRV